MEAMSNNRVNAGSENSSTTSGTNFPRRLRVVTESRRSNKMLRTRTLSELVFMSPRNSPRVTPRQNRFDMDIEVSSTFADGNGGTVDLMACGPNDSALEDSIPSITEEENEELQLVIGSSEMEVEDNDNTAEETRPGRPTDVSSVIDMLFEIHSALKTRHLGQRTAASALAASNLVSTMAFPQEEPIPRDEQLEALENARKMLECAICQDIFTEATEATCCGQIFCKECIERWVAGQGSCPMCREETTMDRLVKSRHAQRMANEMVVACPWCAETMRKAELSVHMDDCTKAPLEPPPPLDVQLRRSLIEHARIEPPNFRHFLMSPTPPQAEMIQCYIRTRGGNYELFTLDGDILLCTAVRRRQLDMSVTFAINMGVDSLTSVYPANTDRQIGRLERNFVGSQYTIYAVGVDNAPSGTVEAGAVQYAATFGKTPRQMRVAIPNVSQAVELSDDEVASMRTSPWRCEYLNSNDRDNSMLNQIERPDTTRTTNLINKPPVWIESLEAYCLDFGGRVAAASVKNFLLSHPDDMDKTLMLFGRTQDRNVYSMDFRHPLSPMQAFSIALSSMDSHLVTFD